MRVEIELVDELGNVIKCIRCEKETPHNKQFGILCKGCMLLENLKWKMFRETNKPKVEYTSAFGEVERVK